MPRQSLVVAKLDPTFNARLGCHIVRHSGCEGLIDGDGLVTRQPLGPLVVASASFQVWVWSSVLLLGAREV
ncbi:MAG: hypothetical protein JO189_34040 [Deltaproteobacteria bacterium]|nr:hypothetical protein [Deltaproteobacteria bacterium]